MFLLINKRTSETIEVNTIAQVRRIVLVKIKRDEIDCALTPPLEKRDFLLIQGTKMNIVKDIFPIAH